MFLNDAFDAPVDARSRADRPIPNGDVTRTEVFSIGFSHAGGRIAAARPAASGCGAAVGAALAAAILYHDYQHKGRAFGPVVMGACRALVYCTVAAGATGVLSMPVAVAAIVMWVYIIGLT